MARLGRDPALAAVLVVNLDRFKEVAERFGDDAVDRLLVAVAGRLRSILRPSDTVSRFGGDEFVVLCPDLAHERDAVRLAERMTARLGHPFAVGGRRSWCRPASASPSPTSPAPTPRRCCRDADAAMYRAKDAAAAATSSSTTTDAGRARSTAWSSRATCAAAVERDELRVHYQPIVVARDRRDRRRRGAGALGAPERGLVLPAEFIPLAEETGLIVPIGALGARRGLPPGARWQANEPAHRRLPCQRQPLGPPARRRPTWSTDVARGAAPTPGSTPTASCLEITESA